MNWVQVYRDDVIASILALLSPALVATLAGLETASLELNAHFKGYSRLIAFMILFSLGFFDHALPSTLQRCCALRYHPQ